MSHQLDYEAPVAACLDNEATGDPDIAGGRADPDGEQALDGCPLVAGDIPDGDVAWDKGKRNENRCAVR